MLDLRCVPPTLGPHHPSHFSRNPIPVPFVPGADCPRFRRDLLERACTPEDTDLLQRWAGMVLVGSNMAQKLVILTGSAGGGKSTFLKIASLLIGKQNVQQLRTHLLLERFELSNFIGMTLLCGADVPGNFLLRDGAHVIKSLTGGDILNAEVKGSRESVQLHGDFNVGITCNSRLRLTLDSDAEAWRRRIVIVPFTAGLPEMIVENFAEHLVEAEGPGIVNWMVEGAVKILAGDKLRLTETQKSRVDDLLEESDSVRSFLRRCIAFERGRDLTSQELVRSYTEFCDDRGWDPLPGKKIERVLPDAMLEIWRVSKSNKIERDGGVHRGFRHVRLITATEDHAEEFDL